MKRRRGADGAEQAGVAQTAHSGAQTKHRRGVDEARMVDGGNAAPDLAQARVGAISVQIWLCSCEGKGKCAGQA
ncbi:hypothetical protein GUJ93_ZPchr0002g23804 [Zizania palustris]|uniref:Uncharacterized protein n=1 Tax=Zizania palustris TaxID=103762 RepID=A0A8J5S5H3_ZIZPA|nr:hypothetical protein GUJ93_ZPchr0002g23804 [Zizania palustris]